MQGIDLGVVFQDVTMTTLKLAAPILVVSLVVGLLISVFQAATQLNEQTMTFVPKLLAIVAVLVIAGPWMMQLLMEFTFRIFEMMTRSL